MIENVADVAAVDDVGASGPDANNVISRATPLPALFPRAMLKLPVVLAPSA